MVADLALAIAAVAAAFSGLSWWTSRKATSTAESAASESKRSADAADRSAAVAEREEQVRLAEHRNAAALITAQLSYSGALAVELTNGSARPIRDLVLMGVTGRHPDWNWTVNQRVMGARSQWQLLHPGETVECPIEFITDHGVRTQKDGDTYQVVFEFIDATGTKWLNRDGDIQVVDGTDSLTDPPA